MTETQRKLLTALQWFHHFCSEHNLRYYAVGGTCLGAVRHKGFIPWDDDIDVGMPRKDYKKFLELTSAIQDNELYKVEYLPSKHGFTYPYCKLYDIGTTLIENSRYKIKRGIYIDVFPLDGIGLSLIHI